MNIKSMLSRLSPWQGSMLLVFILLLAKLVVVSSALGLAVDAAHYGLYAKYPALSYFDHPPMVGWLQIIPYWISPSDTMQMLVPILLSVILPLQIFALTRLLFPQASPWLAFVAVVISQCQLILFALSIAYTPQSPLLCFALAFIYYFWQATHQPQSKLRLWLYCGIFIGLAGLSDYSAVFLGIGALAYLLIYQPKRLIEFRLWLGVIIAAVIVSPVFIWNAQHDWISFTYQAHHGFSAHSWSLKRFFQSQLIQFGAYNPLVYILGIFSFFWAWWHCRKIKAVVYLLLFITPVLLLFGYSGGYTKVLPHWPALAWVLLAIVIAYRLQPRLNHRRWRIYGNCTVALSTLLILITLSLVIYPWLPLPYKKQPFRDLYGWKKAAQMAHNELKQLPIGAQRLYVSNWSLASRLAWYSDLPVQVTGAGRLNQFDLWYGRPKPGQSGLVVLPVGFSLKYGPQHHGEFEHCKLINKLIVDYAQVPVTEFKFFYCQNYQA